MNGKELKAETTRRLGLNTRPSIPINRNQAGYKYRLFLIKDDLSKGINPYLPREIESGLAPEKGIPCEDVL